MEETATLTRTRRIGGSLVVTLPINLVKEKNIQEDEIIEINVNKRKMDGFGSMKGLSSFKREDRAKGQLEK